MFAGELTAAALMIDEARSIAEATGQSGARERARGSRRLRGHEARSV